MSRQNIFVLGGGNALGSYLAGTYEALSLGGLRPDWIVGGRQGRRSPGPGSIARVDSCARSTTFGSLHADWSACDGRA